MDGVGRVEAWSMGGAAGRVQALELVVLWRRRGRKEEEEEEEARKAVVPARQGRMMRWASMVLVKRTRQVVACLMGGRMGLLGHVCACLALCGRSLLA